MPKTKKPQTKEQQLKKFLTSLRSAMRRKSMHSPMLRWAKLAVRRDYEGPERHKFEYPCTICKQWFPDKETEIDHIIPCGSLTELKDIPEFSRKLFCLEEKDDCISASAKYCLFHQVYTKKQTSRLPTLRCF